MARELLLRGGYVVTVDDALRDLPNGDVLIRDDQVAAVGRNLSTSTRDAEVLDVAGRLVIPGLVDTHRHVWQGERSARSRRR
jgi:cytosine/adenosine deaminase-related metal-dependent hydrolase